MPRCGAFALSLAAVMATTAVVAFVCAGSPSSFALLTKPAHASRPQQSQQPMGAAAATAAGQQSSGFAVPLAGLLVLGAATAGGRCAAMTRHAAAVKKGVRVVEGKEIPWNLFGPKSPYKGTTISNDTLTTRSRLCNWQTCHVVMRHDKQLPYLEGQSIGIIAPGPDKKGEVPAKVRLYSIASSSPGDDETYETVSLCVKRVLEVDGLGWCKYSNVKPGTDPEFPNAKMVYRGVCSSHVCDLKPGDDVLITGPVGAELLLPEETDANIIMFATGTGVAPFRSFLRRLFYDKGTKGKFQGIAWLFLGVPFSASLLYDEEWKVMRAENPATFRYDYAISNEEKSEKNKVNGEMWVQHKAMQYQEELWQLTKDKRTHVYMCGLKGMESGFRECLEQQADKEGLEWDSFVKQLKSGNRYHVEVY